MRIGVELMNEPRVSDDGLIRVLKPFHANATEVVQAAAQGGVQIVVQPSFNSIPHASWLTTSIDAFWVNSLYPLSTNNQPLPF